MAVRTLIALLCAVLALAGCGSEEDAPTAPARPASKLGAESGRLVGGGVRAYERQLAALKGTPVVVNQWASWCGPCRFEFPFFREAARRYGFADHVTDWKALVADDRVQLFDNAGPNNLHSEPTIAAAEAGKHVICEKPLGRDAAESYETWQRVAKTGVKHMCAFNYRFVPAVRLARQIIESGELGEIFHFRGTYLQEWIIDPQFPMVWRLDKSVAGSGALGDLGAHVIDQSRYLAGEPTAVSGILRTFIEERPGGTVDVDDAFEATVEFENGAIIQVQDVAKDWGIL